MALDWSSKLVKYALFTFNLLFVITGIILIAIGVSVKAYYYNYEAFLDDKFFSLPNLLIATGSLIFFISFFGCCGAIKESWVLLYAFVGLLILIFILEFSAGIAGYVLRDRTADYLQEQLMEDLKKYGHSGSDQITQMWDLIQYEFECCGVDGPEDWTINFHNKSLPISCCKYPSASIGYSNCALNTTSTFKAAVRKARSPQEGSETNANPANTDPSTNSTTDAPIVAASDTTNVTNATSLRTTPVPTTTTPGPIIYNGTYYTTGCVKGFGDFLKSHAVTLGGCGLALAFIQLLGIIFACHLARKIKIGYYST